MKEKIKFFNLHNLAFLAIFLFFLGCLFLSDEGRKPLIYTNDELRNDFNNNSFTFFTPKFLFNKGEYNFSVDFDRILQNNAKIELWKQSEKLTEWQILPNSNNFSSDFTLPADSQDVQFRLIFENIENAQNAHNQQSTIIAENIKKVSIVPKTFFYSDTYFMIFLFFTLAIFAQFYFCKHKLSQQQIIDFCLILGIAILCTFPFFDTTIKMRSLETNIDLPNHLVRIEGVKDAILDGQIGANILPNGTENYGQLNSLYPYLFLYIPACLRLCRTSLMFSYKFLLFLMNLATVLSVFYSLKSVTKSRINIFLAVILYVFAPHRLHDIFRCAAIGQILAMIFWPLIIAYFYNLIVKNEQKNHYLIIGMSGMLQSHILSSMMACVLCATTCLVFIKQIIQKKYYLGIIKSSIIVALLNAWFLVPFAFYYLTPIPNCDLGQLTISTYYEVTGKFSHIFQFNYISDTSLGISICICIPIIIFSLIKKDKKQSETNFTIFLLFLGLLLCFMTTGYFPNRLLQQKLSIFDKIAKTIQSPMRLLDPACLFIIFASAIALENNDFLKNKRIAIFAILSVFSISSFMEVIKDTDNLDFGTSAMIASKGHKQKLSPQFHYSYEYNNNETNARYCASYEKVPCYFHSNGIDFYPYPLASEKNVEITNFVKRGTKLSFCYKVLPNAKIENAKTSNILSVEVPLQWYTGYKAFDENKTPLPITKSALGKIQIPLNLDGNEHKIFVQYGKIPLFVIANIISAIFLCALAGYFIYKKKYFLFQFFFWFRKILNQKWHNF